MMSLNKKNDSATAAAEFIGRFARRTPPIAVRENSPLLSPLSDERGGGSGESSEKTKGGIIMGTRKDKVPCYVAGYRVNAVPGEKYTLGQGGNCWGPIPVSEVVDGMDTEGVFEAVPIIQPVAVLSTTVLPLDGIYEVRTIDPSTVDIEGVPHYIGHPATKGIVEQLGAVQAESKLFAGLEPGEVAVCFSIKQGRSTRAKDGFTSPHQDISADDLMCRVIRRMKVWEDRGTGDVIVTTSSEPYDRYEEI